MKGQIPGQYLVIDTGREVQNIEVLKGNRFQIANQNHLGIIKNKEAQEEKVVLIQNLMSVVDQEDHVIVVDQKDLEEDLQVIAKVGIHQNHSGKNVMDEEADLDQWKRVEKRIRGLILKKSVILGHILLEIKNEEIRYKVVDLRTIMAT